MGDLINLEEKQFKSWAKRFVTIYEEDGDTAAGKYIHDNVPEEMWEILQGYIREEFEDKGYSFGATN